MQDGSCAEGRGVRVIVCPPSGVAVCSLSKSCLFKVPTRFDTEHYLACPLANDLPDTKTVFR